jgi:hypothetical protein
MCCVLQRNSCHCSVSWMCGVLQINSCHCSLP